MKATEIGIDLGHYDIKIALIKEINPGSKMQINSLEDYDYYPVNSPLYSDEYFKEVRDAIKDFSKRIKKSRLSLNFSVPYSKEFTQIEFIEMPILEEKDIKMGVKFEAEQLMAEKDSKSYVSTYRTNKKFEELNEQEILFATMDNSIIKGFSRFKTINWKVNKLVIQPVLLERFVKDNDIVIDFGYNVTRLYMYKMGILSEINLLNASAKDVNLKVKEYIQENKEEIELMGLDFEDEDLVENLIKKIYVRNDFIEDDEIYKNLAIHVEDTLANIIEEIKISIRSFELKNGMSVDNIFYTGGLSKVKYLDKKLQSELDGEVLPLRIVSTKDDKPSNQTSNFLNQYSESAYLEEEEEVEEVEENLAYEIAALSAISTKEKDKLNFSQFLRANIDYNSILVGAATLSLSAMLMMNILHGKYDDIIAEQQTTLTEQQNTIALVDGNLAGVNMSIQESTDFINKMNAVSADKPWLSDFLYILPDITPITTSITKMTITEGKVMMEGYGADYSAVGFLANKLNGYGTATILTIDESTEANLYSVTSSKPESISDKYKMTKKFTIEFTHNAPLMR